MYNRNTLSWFKHVDFFIIDEVSMQLAFLIASIIRFGKPSIYSMPVYHDLLMIMFLVDLMVLVSFNTMSGVLRRGFFKEVINTVKHSSIVFAITMAYMFALKSGGTYSRIFMAASFLCYIFLSYFSRVIWREYILKNGVPTWARGRLLVVSVSEKAEQIIKSLKKHGTDGYELAGIVLSDECEEKEIAGVPVVTTLDKAADYICKQWIDAVYIDEQYSDPRIIKLMDDCRQMALPVHLHIPSLNETGAKQFVEKIGGTFVLTTTVNYATPVQALGKRCIDILGGVFGSIIAVIIMMIFGPVIKIASPGPILYKQERIGKNGKRFKILKLRSMYMNADEMKTKLMEQNKVKSGMMFKMDFDPRIIGNRILPDGTKKTGIGEFIRKYSLDEFPQFFNVLVGQMSLVGTRPPTVDEWERYEFHHRGRLACKPGITGMWQVSGRSGITDFEEVVRLDTEYITNWSFGLDFRILLKTIGVVIRHEGAM